MASSATHQKPSPAEVSTLMSVPADIFAEIARRLPLADLRNLPSLSKVFSDNPHVFYALYREPFQADDFVEHYFIGAEADAFHRNADGARIRFRRFLRALAANPDRGRYVQKIAMSHFSTVEDFAALERHCPNLRSLDLSNIAEKYYGTGWSWHDLVIAYPLLFKRLQLLKVSGAIYQRRRLHKPESKEGRKNRTANGHDDALTFLLRASTALETLAVVGAAGFSWADVDCQSQLSAAIVKGAGPHLRTIRLWDMATSIRSFQHFLKPLTALPRLRTICLNFHSTLELFTSGDTREVADYTYLKAHGIADATCTLTTTKDLRQYLAELRSIVREGRWDIRSLDPTGTECRHNPRSLYPLVNDDEGLELLRFMTSHFGWRSPILAWDFLSRSSPLTGSARSLAAMDTHCRAAELRTIAKLMSTLRALGIPVAVELSTAHSRECVFFESAVATTEDWYFSSVEHHSESTPPSSPSSLSTSAAPLPQPLGSLIDSLTITYPSVSPLLIRPGQPGSGTKSIWHGQLLELDMSLLDEDVTRFRPFWNSFKSNFTKLSCLRICVPHYVFARWSAEGDVLHFLPGIARGADGVENEGEERRWHVKKTEQPKRVVVEWSTSR
ncbi:MAG: hypothetical protein M1815_004771 [Lichina confinis]|nr:MAG: hypothetical protein M1815_004771 [Lichina confinis]